MIPNQKTLQQINEILKTQTSHKQVIRQNPKTKSKLFKGECLCCGRVKTLVKIKHPLCKMCYNWLYCWIRSKYGYYNEKHVVEALTEFKKPIKCRFYGVCGSNIPRLTPEGTLRPNRSAICDRCRVVFEAGYQLGLKRIKNRIKFPIKEQEYASGR